MSYSCSTPNNNNNNSNHHHHNSNNKIRRICSLEVTPGNGVQLQTKRASWDCTLHLFYSISLIVYIIPFLSVK